MDVERLRALLEQVQAGETPVEEALESLRSLPFEDLGFAKLDHHRTLRNGFPEVVYCPGKTTEHILSILERLTARSRKVLASRATPEVAAAVQWAFPQAVYHEVARMLVVPGTEGIPVSRYSGIQDNAAGSTSEPLNTPPGTVLVVSAGTADI